MPINTSRVKDTSFLEFWVPDALFLQFLQKSAGPDRDLAIYVKNARSSSLEACAFTCCVLNYVPVVDVLRLAEFSFALSAFVPRTVGVNFVLSLVSYSYMAINERISRSDVRVVTRLARTDAPHWEGYFHNWCGKFKLNRKYLQNARK